MFTAIFTLMNGGRGRSGLLDVDLKGFFIKMNGLRSNLLMNMLVSYAISCVINISGVIKDMC